MRRTFVLTLVVATGISFTWVRNAHAAFTLTDKNDSNPMNFTTSASDVYVMETKDTQPPTAPGNVAGFTFDTQNGSGPMLTNNASGDFREGYSQSLAGNATNGYVGTVLGKAWGNAITLSLGAMQLVNGPGVDLYVTAKNVVGGIVQNTSTQDKSFAIGFHVTNGTDPGWHLYNASALPSNFNPPEGSNVLGAIDLSDLKFSSGNFLDADLAGISTTMPVGTLIDKIILVNNNVQNDWAFGYLGDTSESPTGFVARRDFDNADNDGNAATGVDYLTARYGDRGTNGQDGPQAWFLGLNNTVTSAVPEPGAFLVGLLECGCLGLVVVARRLYCRCVD